MENYTSDKKDPTLTFMVQPGYVEGITAETLRFHSVETAFENLFRNNKEFCIIVWNEIPFRLNYHEDIPFLIRPLTSLLGYLSYSEEKNHEMALNSKNCNFTWTFSTTDDDLIISGNYSKIAGGHEKALNSVAQIRTDTTTFLKEWKLLIEQIVTAFHESEYEITHPEDQKVVNDLAEINGSISERALRYQYDKR